MTESNQQQKAGANSSQYQIAGNLVINEGVTEERAYEISKKTFREMYAEYSEESFETAGGRVEQLDVRYIKQLADAGLLGALADPAYQVTLRKAQLGAASTERESDYDLLAGLLTDRAKRSGDRPVRAGINRAVEIIDQLDDEALAGLTVMTLITSLIPAARSITQGIQAMETILSQVMEGQQLPAGVDWLEHLDILDAVRIDRVQSFKPFPEYWCGRTPGYLAVGVLADSEEELRGIQELAEIGLPAFVADHELKPGYRRINFATVESMSVHLRTVFGVTGDRLAVAERIARDVYGMDKIDPELTATYMERVNALPLQARVGEWWSALPHHFAITAVGKVLARANMKRLDKLGLYPDLG